MKKTIEAELKEWSESLKPQTQLDIEYLLKAREILADPKREERALVAIEQFNTIHEKYLN